MNRPHSDEQKKHFVVIKTGFSLQGFIDERGLQFGESGKVKFRAWVSPMLAAQLADTRLTEAQTLKPANAAGGGYVLTATEPRSWLLRWWILSKSGDIEILSPKDLRHEIADLLTEATARYREPRATPLKGTA